MWTEALDHASHAMGSLWIRQLKRRNEKLYVFACSYFLLGNGEDTFKLNTWVKYRQAIDLIRSVI